MGSNLQCTHNVWLHWVSETLAEVCPYGNEESSDTLTHHIQLMTGARALTIEHSAFSILAGLIVEMTFIQYAV